MNTEALQAAKVYRSLLKAVAKHVGKEDYKSHFREFITQEFRNHGNLSDTVLAQKKIKLARDYTFMLNSVHHHQRMKCLLKQHRVLPTDVDLLFSYNIAVDRSDEMKRVLGKSAASVGLRLPEVSQS